MQQKFVSGVPQVYPICTDLSGRICPRGTIVPLQGTDRNIKGMPAAKLCVVLTFVWSYWIFSIRSNLC